MLCTQGKITQHIVGDKVFLEKSVLITVYGPLRGEIPTYNPRISMRSPLKTVFRERLIPTFGKIVVSKMKTMVFHGNRL
jgi:hypothetical protein